MGRFIIRQHPYCGLYQINEVVSETPQFGTLTITWDMLHSTIETAVARIEKELRIKLVRINESQFVKRGSK